MKFITLFTLLLIVFVGYTSAQACWSMPGRPNCSGPRNVGRSARGCVKGTRWYYDARLRQCQSMNYLGCFGNNNRWCTLEACRRNCVRG